MPISTLHKIDKNLAKNEKGQSLIEFILLLLVLVIITFAMMRGFNSLIAERWTSLIKIIAAPTDTPIEM